MASRSPNVITQARLATTALRVSGVVGGIGVVFLIGMYGAFAVGAQSAGMAVGWINDVTAVVTVPLALPGMVLLQGRLRPRAQRSSDVLLAIAVASTAAISILQLMLVTGVLTFEQEIGPVMIAYLLLGAWFVVTGRIAQQRGLLPRGTLLGTGAALYVGYPVWAFRLARALDEAPETLPEPASA